VSLLNGVGDRVGVARCRHSSSNLWIGTNENSKKNWRPQADRQNASQYNPTGEAA
jgi:hypothetical protein